mgnify:CR=1 FL=1|jgi:hypothetical protein
MLQRVAGNRSPPAADGEVLGDITENLASKGDRDDHLKGESDVANLPLLKKKRNNRATGVTPPQKRRDLG